MRKRPFRRNPSRRTISTETEIGFHICEFAYGHGNCSCKKQGRGEPCEALTPIINDVISLAREGGAA